MHTYIRIYTLVLLNAGEAVRICCWYVKLWKWGCKFGNSSAHDILGFIVNVFLSSCLAMSSPRIHVSCLINCFIYFTVSGIILVSNGSLQFECTREKQTTSFYCSGEFSPLSRVGQSFYCSPITISHLHPLAQLMLFACPLLHYSITSLVCLYKRVYGISVIICRSVSLCCRLIWWKSPYSVQFFNQLQESVLYLSLVIYCWTQSICFTLLLFNLM